MNTIFKPLFFVSPFEKYRDTPYTMRQLVQMQL